MDKLKNIKWKDKLLYEKIFTVLVIVFAIATLTLIILDSIYNNRLLSRLSNIFLTLELISVCIVNYRLNKKVSIILIAIELLALILTLVKIFV